MVPPRRINLNPVTIRDLKTYRNLKTEMKQLLIITLTILNSLLCMVQANWPSNLIGSVFARQGGELPEGTFRFKSGGYTVYTLVTADKTFQPTSLYYGPDDVDKVKVDGMAPDGKVPTSMNCFVVATPEGYTMFDTGLPVDKGGKVLERLAELKIEPSAIKRIFITHGHFDHVGGLLDDVGHALFPSAELFIPAAEVDFLNKTMGGYLDKLQKAYKERLATFNAGSILPGEVVALSAPGHTPGHTAYQMGNLLFIGDLVHGPSIQLLDPTICANFDADRAEAVTTRNKVFDYAVANSLTVLGAHVPLNGVLF